MPAIDALGKLGQSAWDAGGDIVDSITGESGREAALDAAQVQADAGKLAIEEAKAAREQSRADLQPFTQFGGGVLPQLQNLLTPEGQAAYASESNPLFQAALANLNKQTTQQAAVRGRAGAGDTKQNYLQNWQAAAMPYLQNQQNMLFNAAGIGQASAAGQANQSMVAGQNIGNTLTDIGAARAGGVVGAANAKAAGIKDIVGGVTSIYGGF